VTLALWLCFFTSLLCDYTKHFDAFQAWLASIGGGSGLFWAAFTWASGFFIVLRAFSIIIIVAVFVLVQEVLVDCRELCYTRTVYVIFQCRYKCVLV
jgi:hypothetical protein